MRQSWQAGTLSFSPYAYHLPITSVAHAETKEYTGVGESIISTRETLEIWQQGAKLQAERNAIEQAGVFISSYSKASNSKLDSDEIITFTSGIVKINDKVKYELIPLNDDLGTVKYRATVVVSIDTDDLNKRINDWIARDSQERSKLNEQSSDLIKTIEDLKRRNAELEQMIANAKTPQDDTNIKTKITELSSETLYAQKYDEANKMYNQGNFKEAIKLYTEVIEMNPNNSKAYNNRGIAYQRLGDNTRAQADFAKAESLK